MKIGTKLALALFTAAIVLAGGRFLSLSKLEEASLHSKGDDLANRAGMVMSEIEEDIYDRIDELRLCASASSLPQSLAESNRRFDETPDVEQKIAEEDAAWQADQSTPLLEKTLNRPLSKQLLRYMDYLERVHGCVVFSELFATNKYGVVIATTGRTSDYLQNDEPWYEAAIVEETGWIGDVTYDESAKTTSFDLVMPIRTNSGELLGVLKGVLNVQYVGRTVEEVQRQSIYKSAKAYLVSETGRALLIASTAASPTKDPSIEIGGFGDDLSAHPAVVAALASRKGYQIYSDKGIDKLAVFSHAVGSEVHPTLGWTLVVVYDRNEVLHDVLTAQKLSLIGSTIVLALAALAGLLFSRSIAVPVTRLTAAATEIANGQDHSRVADRGRKDELGGLVRAFNRMADELTVFRKFAEASGHGFGMSELDGRLTYANPALCRLFSADAPDDLVGKSILPFYPEDVREDVEGEIIPTIIQEGYWYGELPLIAHDGSQKPTLQYIFLIRDERSKPLCLAYVVADIEDLRRAETALRENHEELQAIYDRMGDGVLVADLQTKQFLRANRAICEMLGRSEDELLTMSVVDIHPPDEVDRTLQVFEDQASGRLPVAESVPFLRRDGSIFYADITTRNVTYKQRSCQVGLIHDITERKEALEALEREHETLRRLLESHDQERRLISYEIHDGLAQQLTAAIMQCQAFMDRDRQNDCSQADFYGLMYKMLCDSLAEARRMISGLRPPILDESGVVTAIRDLAHGAANSDGPDIEFHTRVSFNRLEPVLENALYRIAQEALNNACRHSGSKRVRVEIIQIDKQVQISVEDWGSGFDPDSVSKKRYGLTGIRERTRLLGGQVTIDTEAGQGTRVSVVLPIGSEKS